MIFSQVHLTKMGKMLVSIRRERFLKVGTLGIPVYTTHDIPSPDVVQTVCLEGEEGELL